MPRQKAEETERAERIAEVARRIRGGETTRQIAARMKISQPTVVRLSRQANELYRESARSDIEVVKGRQAARIEDLVCKLMPKVDTDPQVARTIARLMEREAKLFGLDGPTKVEHHHTGDAPAPQIAVANVRLEILQNSEFVEWQRQKAIEACPQPRQP